MIHIQLSQEPLSGVDGQPGDQQVLSLVISQQEGQAALAELTFISATKPYAWCAIAEDETLLFVGQLVGLAHADTRTMQATYRACQAMPTPPKDLPYDPLFFDEPHISQYLEASPYLFYINRCTGLPQLSHVLEGSHCVTLPHVLKAETRTLYSPYTAVRVSIDVEWVQKHEGTFDLAPSLHAACEGGQLQTLTPQSLMQAWPKEGPFLSAQRGQHNGYTVVESYIEHDERVGGASPHQTTWLNGHVWVHWRYAQKRAETVEFEIPQKLSPLWQSGSVHTINWRLQAVDDAENPVIPATSSSFWNTARGQKALQYAVQLAHHHLHMSRRCMETTFTVPFNALPLVKLDAQAAFQGIQGKISSYSFVYAYGRSSGEVRVRHVVPCDNEALPTVNWHPIKPDGFLDVPPSTMVEKLEIHNQAFEQLAYLASGGSKENMPSTQFFVRLLELGQHQTLTQKVNLNQLYP